MKFFNDPGSTKFSKWPLTSGAHMFTLLRRFTCTCLIHINNKYIKTNQNFIKRPNDSGQLRTFY